MQSPDQQSTPGAPGKIYISCHKPFRLLNETFLQPIHVGRACRSDMKDRGFSSDDLRWMEKYTIGDDSGDHISDRNREYSEATGLYWVWKNTDYASLPYIGFFQYRRQLILNDFFRKAKDNPEKAVYQCVHLPQNTQSLCEKIGLSDQQICALLELYDCILPNPVPLQKMIVSSIYADWVEKIEGVHVDDLILLEEYFSKRFPDDAQAFRGYLNGSEKLMYQIFITKPDIFAAYCAWLFDILFAIDDQIDTSLYTVNGKRTMGYLAEILYGFYFTHIIQKQDLRAMHCGITFLE